VDIIEGIGLQFKNSSNKNIKDDCSNEFSFSNRGVITVCQTWMSVRHRKNMDVFSRGERGYRGGTTLLDQGV